MEWAKEKDIVINTVGYHKLSVMEKDFTYINPKFSQLPCKVQRWGNWGSERLCNLPKFIPQVLKWKSRQLFWLQNLWSFHYLILPQKSIEKAGEDVPKKILPISQVVFLSLVLRLKTTAPLSKGFLKLIRCLEISAWEFWDRSSQVITFTMKSHNHPLVKLNCFFPKWYL